METFTIFVVHTLIILFFLILGAVIRAVYIERTKVLYGARYTNNFCQVYVYDVDNGDVIFVDNYNDKHRMSIERFINQFTIVPAKYKYTYVEKIGDVN